jgi:hypothetical protein
VTDSHPRPDAAPPPDGPALATPGDRALLVVLWAWAVVLVAATLAQVFGWEGLLDALDAKRWFSG